MRRAAIVVCAVPLVLLLAALGSYVFARRSLSPFSGSAELAGLTAPVEIVRDRHAVPHVFAGSLIDAQRALGYLHGRDRLWQLELHRRLGAGSLAAVFGPDALADDRFFRTVGGHVAAARELDALDDETRAALDAYVAGINAAIDDLEGRWPPEFSLLGIEPGRWTPLDCLSWLKVMAWTLSANWERELERLYLSERLSPEQIAAFFREPVLPMPELRRSYGALPAALSPLVHSARAEHGRRALGSNNWAVDGTRSASGKPLLANDPHLDWTAPSLWYLAHLEAPEASVIGATLPGVPGVILGQNERVAWAFTNTESDTQDLYVERLDPSDPERYSTPEGPRPFARRREVIEVKGAPADVLEVRESRHGPIISDAFEDGQRALPDDVVLALAWGALAPGDQTIRFPLAANRAKSGAELAQAARFFHAAQQNVVYADVEGAIGFVAAGRVPRRGADDDLKGRAPAPGWLARYDWQGFIPFEELPAQQAPASGRIVTANQDITPPGYAHWLTSEWAPPHRAERIGALLDAEPKHSLESFRRIQLDVASGSAAALMPALLAHLGDDGERTELVARLRAWRFEMKAGAPEPLIFAAWLRELSRLVCEDELGDAFEPLSHEVPELLRDVLGGKGDQARWCDDVRTPAREQCATQVRAAFARALAALEQRHGGDWQGWQWGRAHPARSRHVPFSDVPLLSRWFELSVPAGGDGESVNVAGYSLADDGFDSDYGAGYRALYDLADRERSRFVLSTGQSGHPLSPHYADQNELWARGEDLPMWTRRETLSVGALGTLRLTPARDGAP